MVSTSIKAIMQRRGKATLKIAARKRESIARGERRKDRGGVRPLDGPRGESLTGENRPRATNSCKHQSRAPTIRRAGVATNVLRRIRAAMGRRFSSVAGVRAAIATVPTRRAAPAMQQMFKRIFRRSTWECERNRVDDPL